MSRDVMTVKELAEYLGLHPQTVYEKVREGEIPTTQVGKTYRFPRTLINEWLKENTKQRKVGKSPRLNTQGGKKGSRDDYKVYPLGVKGKLTRKDIYEDLI